MGFLNGGITFQRFRINGPKPGIFEERHLERLRDHVAGRQTAASADGIEIGWSAGTHILDTDFRLEKNIYPDHLLFDLWTQANRLPPERLKAYYEIELRALSKDNTTGRPTPRQKREAKEAARDRLVNEAKDGRYRKWKCVPALWDGITNHVFFGASGSTYVDRFTGLWDRTFGGDLTQEALSGKLSAITAGSLAIAINASAAHVSLSPFVPGVTPEDHPTWCAILDLADFLGNEFLLWLWYYSEVESDTIQTPDGAYVTFMFSGGVKVEDPRGMSGDCTANSASAVRLPEARAAVRSGKLPRKAALTVARHGEQFRFVLQAETMALSGVKLPPWKGDGSQREREMDRLQNLRDLAEIVDNLFAAFLARRISGYWSQECKGIEAWLKSGKAVTA